MNRKAARVGTKAQSRKQVSSQEKDVDVGGPALNSEGEVSESGESEESGESDSESEPESGSEDAADDSGESESESEEEAVGDEENAGDVVKRPRKTKQDKIEEGAEDFDTALNAILGSKIKAHDRQDPIMVRNKRRAKDIEDAKVEARARKLLKAEKLESKDRARVKEIIPLNVEKAGAALQHEKVLKKIAQRGVVRLFNAIHTSQRASTETVKNTSSIGVDKKSQEATQVSKETFLDMIRSG